MKRSHNCLQPLAPWIFSLLFALGCSSGPVRDTTTPQGAYEDAMEYVKEERYQESLTKLNDVKNKHPYSNYAVMAELSIADVYYDMESYPEAQAAYEIFKDLHPNHPRSDYVLFRLAMTYYMRLPETVDRDLIAAPKAVAYFQDLERLYPKSEYLEEVRKNRATVIKKMAEKEFYVGRFYFTREQFDSALGRFDSLIKNYPDSDLRATSLYHAAQCADRLGQQNRMKVYLDKLQDDYPNSSEAKDAKQKLPLGGEG